MATRMIVKNGDPQLRKHCHEVKDFNPRLHMLLDDMRQTLAESNGVGLAAPQVGVLRRAVIVLETNVPDGEDEYMIELINPVIVETAGEQIGAEGCLSVPDEYGIVARPDYVKVRAQDRHGEWFEVEGHGLRTGAEGALLCQPEGGRNSQYHAGSYDQGRRTGAASASPLVYLRRGR